MSIVHKTETRRAAGRNRLSFVLSDATPDRYGDVIDPNGWELRDFQRNPIALFGHNSDFPIGKWKNLRVENAQLIGDLDPAQKGTSARIDEIVSLIEQDILVATSVGFVPIEREPRKEGGVHYKRQSLLETSIVGIPANPSALAIAKSLHLSPETIRMAFGEQAEERPAAPGVKAAPPPVKMKGASMTTPLSKRIEDAQNDLIREKDALTAHIADADADTNVTDELSLRIEQKDAALAALKRAEAALAVKTGGPAVTTAVPASARPAGQGFAKASKPADMIIRSAIVHGIAEMTHQQPLDVLDRLYGHDEGVGMLVKAAVAPATTTVAGWAAELVNTAMTDFMETLRPESVYPALAAAGGGRLTFGPNSGAIKIPARSATPSIGGSFIGEGAAIPVRRLALTSTTLVPYKMGVITTFTREMTKYSMVALEAMLRQEIVYDTAITLDGVLLGAGAGDAATPKGLLNGVTALTPTAGGGHAAFLGDMRKLRAPFDSANAGSGLVLLMNPAQAEGLELTAGPDGTLGFAGAILTRYRVATSTAIPVGRVIMVRGSDFASATGDVPEFEISNDATVHMEDTAPLAISTAGTPNVVAAPVRSFFQTGVSGLRMIMDVSWAMRRPGMTQFIDGVTW